MTNDGDRIHNSNDFLVAAYLYLFEVIEIRLCTLSHTVAGLILILLHFCFYHFNIPT